VWCWGDNHFGQLAEPATISSRFTPGQVTLGCGSAPRPPGLTLVSARDHIPGNFLVRHAITADAQRIYLASTSSGKLFVLARDRAADFPLLQTVEVPNPGLGLISVMADDDHVRVTTFTGEVVVYAKGPSLTFESRQTLAPRGSTDAVWSGNQVIIADGIGSVAANSTRVWIRPLSTGDRALAFTLPEFTAGPVYAPPFDASRAFAFARATGAPLGDLPGRNRLEATDDVLALFDGGPSSTPLELRDPVSFALRMTIPHPGANAVVWSGGLLVLGDEDGSVDLWRTDGAQPVLLDRAPLRILTGHTGIEDIEIRALWTDAHDRLIFAGSSWGNDQSRSLDLPSFFVLERTGD
jgi:hypothetical protein